jgi:hypothetical protein
MSSITVTTQAGIHSSHQNNNLGSQAETRLEIWIPVLTVALIILVRGAIKTFK